MGALRKPMAVEQVLPATAADYLREMRAIGFRFYAIDDARRPGLLIMNPVKRMADEQHKRSTQLEGWARGNLTTEQLKQAVKAAPADRPIDWKEYDYAEKA